VRKSQIILVASALVAVVLLYSFGRTIPKKSADTSSVASPPATSGMTESNVQPIAFPDLLAQAKRGLSPEKIVQLTELENSVVRGDVKDQRIQAYHQLAGIWDSLGNADLTAHYLGEAAKLENSEKSLTFAANLFLEQLDHTNDASVQKWETNQADTLLQQALKLNPDNDSVKVALADVYVEGGDVMKGVQQLLTITQKDSMNADANLLLGKLSVRSGQYDKAIGHLEKVVHQQPGNTEALYFLAVSYREMGDNQQAIHYFELCKKLVNDPMFNKEIDSLVNTMK
jgi:tetratricopeptide (TPR) repeat protein